MRTGNHIVMLMNSDTQVLKGLMLMLEDMQFTVIPVKQWQELEKVALNLSQCPALLMLPLEINKHQSGIEQVRHLRTLFQHRVPAILFSCENGVNHQTYVDEEIIVLSEHISPKQLRNTIIKFLANELSV